MFSVEVATINNGVSVVYVKFDTLEECWNFVDALLYARNIERPVIWNPQGYKVDAYAR